jgi:hypothetical protein
MKKLILQFSIVTLMILLSLNVNAQVPQRLNYQGIARNASGTALASQAIGLRLSVLDAGNPVYVETHNVTTNNFGLYTLAIGTGSVTQGTFAGINWGTGSKALKVEIDPAGGTAYTLAGNTDLLSVPYALYAANGGTAGPTGPQGPTGPAGTQGLMGATGATGPQGASGPAGAQGLQGAAGATGATGSTGPVGPTGATGATGPSGSTGPANTLAIGTVSNGGSAAATITGTAPNQTLNLTLPAGPSGAQGNQGVQGVQGVAGPANTLTIGTVSSSTIPAATITGVSPNQVLNLVLATGPTGATGAAGPQGATGSQGATGPQGNTGATGPQGPQGLGAYIAGTGISISGSTISNTGDLSTTNELQTLSIAGNTISLSNTGGSVVLPQSVSGTGTPNYVTKFIGTSSIGNSQILDNGQGVGINTINPANRLDVRTSSSTTTLDSNSAIYGYANNNSSCFKGAISAGYNATYYGSAIRGNGYGGSLSTGFSADIGVLGKSSQWGVYGYGEGYSNVFGTTGIGVIGNSQDSVNGIGVLGAASGTNGQAGYFIGDLTATGMMAKGGGTFKIDHPLDPENKFLYHSFVESPEMMNVYNGNIITDAHGEAKVEMPSYFSALNKDFRYQLTVIGTFAQAIIAEEMNGNTFVIKTDKPNVKVSWQVTGVRQDAFANAHRVVAEVAKKPNEVGTYIHPVENGQPASKGFNFKILEIMKPVNAAKAKTIR